ncbi:hypothetical protein [Thiolinea disciformis]|uniref:hypothetical protein n=1 Tax=Thiolinea disciformis TaxID=125614 RepID=UPI0003808197|nr:hypothetical protein [Thiolinea disciformis]
MFKSFLWVLTSVLLSIAPRVYAHTGLWAHSETSHELSHWVMHGLMVVPVIIGAWMLATWISKVLERRAEQRRD